MNISFTDTLTPKTRRVRSVIMTVAACALSTLNIFMEKMYAGAKTLPYDPSMLYLLTFAVSGVLLACALTVLSHESKHSMWVVSLISAFTVVSAHIALSASPADILLALAFIPSAVVISSCISGGCEKAHTVVANAVVLGLVFFLSALLEHYSAFGEVSARSVAHTANVIRESFLSIYSMYDYTSLGLTLAQITEAFNAVVLLTPALFCAFAAVISYIEITIARPVILGQGISSENLKHWPLKMSRLASLVFLAAFLMMALSISDDSNTFFTTMINLMLVLLPGFFLIGIRTSILHFRRPGLFGMIFGIFIIITCIQNPAMFFILVATIGAFDNLFTTFRARLYGETRK